MADEVVWRSDGDPLLEVVRRADGRHHLRAQAGTAGVVAVAQRPDGRVLLGRHARPAVGASLWELPRGFGESADAGVEAARELYEETGWRATATEVLGVLAPDSGVLAGRVVVVRCEVADTEPETARDDELAQLRWLTPDEAVALVTSDEPVDGLTAAALLLLLARTDAG